jgi:threonine dehydrogenase-like Zn-dependent dehydrogenase
MKAIAVVPSQRRVACIDVPEPALRTPTDVKLRILDVGVCGTDREICSFQYGTPPAGDDHLVIGHESLAEVVEVGAGVTRLRPGDLVVPMVR